MKLFLKDKVNQMKKTGTDQGLQTGAVAAATPLALYGYGHVLILTALWLAVATLLAVLLATWLLGRRNDSGEKTNNNHDTDQP